MIPLLATTTLHTIDYLKNFIDKIDYPVDRLSILCNSSSIDYFVEVTKIKKNSFVNKIYYSFCPYNMGCSMSWNYHIKMNPHSKYWIIVGDDISFSSGDLERANTVAQNNIISFDDVNSNSELSELEKKVLVAGRQDGKKISGSIDRSLAEVSSDRYDSFVPGNYDNEDAYALGQSFWFRSFKAFFGTVYLTKKEQNEPNELQINLISSTFASLFLIFLFIIAVIFLYRINQE